MVTCLRLPRKALSVNVVSEWSLWRVRVKFRGKRRRWCVHSVLCRLHASLSHGQHTGPLKYADEVSLPMRRSRKWVTGTQSYDRMCLGTLPSEARVTYGMPYVGFWIHRRTVFLIPAQVMLSRTIIGSWVERWWVG